MGLLLIILGLWNFVDDVGRIIVSLILIGLGFFYIFIYPYLYAEHFLK